MNSDPMDIEKTRGRVLRWYSRHRRALPWRQTRDPYAIWVSEIMLQQTQVDTVIDYYHRFLQRFPTVQRLARARLDTVLKLWEGLGYYGRARNLHRAAKVVSRDFQGRLPADVKTLMTLPGIGRYTAGAIASIAYAQPEPLVDGNVIRVFCRWHLIEDDPAQSATRRRLWQLATRWVAGPHPGDWNQSLMELGAVVCRPQQPDCTRCPLRADCRACQEGCQESLPRTAPRREVPTYTVALGIVWRDGRILIDQRPTEGHLGGLWEFPGGKRQGNERLEDTVVREIREEIGMEVAVRGKLMLVRHAYTHFRVRLHVFQCDYLSGVARALQCARVKWVRPRDLKRYAFPAANLKMIERLLSDERSGSGTVR